MPWRISEAYSSSIFFGDSHKIENLDHFSVAKPENGDARQHKLLKEFLMEMINNASDKILNIDFDFLGRDFHSCIAHGSRGVLVKSLQGYLNLYPDGIYGKKTVEAVKAFQDSVGIKADGIVGAQTWSYMPIMWRGAKGENVKTLQRKLNLKTDGIFGGATERAVIEFQRKNNICVDGVVGPETLRKLGINY